VAAIPIEQVDHFVHDVAGKITPQSFEGEIIIIPTQSFDTKIECINPKYITDEKLIAEHTEKLEKLKKELQTQLDILNDMKNE
jgi:hypothetical protein